MTLKERYFLKGKIGYVFFFSFLTLFFVLCFTIAKYEKFLELHTSVEIANWNIMLNEKPLTSASNTLENSIILVPTTNVDSANPKKIKPGQSGYFDIQINPNGTEVSIEYKIAIDLANSNLPEHLTISTYSINGGVVTALPSDKSVSGSILLSGLSKFSSANTQTIRYFWNWNDEGMDITSYSIAINVELKQYI